MNSGGGEQLQPVEFAQRCAIVAGISILALAAAAFLWEVSQGVLVIFSAILLAVMLNGLSEMLTRHVHMHRRWALAVTITLLGLLIIGVFMLGGSRILSEAPQLRHGLTQSLGQIRHKLQSMGVNPKAMGLSGGGINSIPSGAALFEHVNGYISTSIELATDTLVILVAGIYFAASPRLYIHTATLLCPPSKRARVHDIAHEVGNGLWRWLLGRCASMLAVGVMAIVGLSALGVHLAVLLGFIAGALTFIPYLGTIISLMPAVLMGLLQSPMTAVYVLLLFLGAHLLEGYILTPLIQEKTVHLAPAWLIVAQLLGGLAAGIFGIVIAAPVMVVVTIMVQMLYIEDVLGDNVRLLGE